MKTKHLLMAMTLPLAFAACTSEEFESVGNGNNLASRKMIGNVTIAFDGGAAQTRWSDAMLPEINDRVGAVLIDQYNGGDNEDAIKNYSISLDQIYTNYQYTFDGSSAWTTNANLVEGNYYFYAPYVASQGRGLMELNMPITQKLDVKDGKIDGNSAIANFVNEGNTPFYIGYKFLDASESNTNITVNMKHLFSYPRFTFTNKTGSDVKLTRIFVENDNPSGGFIAKATLANEKIGGTNGELYITGDQDAASIAAAMEELEEAKDPSKVPANAWGDWTKVFAGDAGVSNTIPEGLEELKTEDLLKVETRTKYIRVDLSEAVTIAKGESVTFRVVMPAAEYAKDDLTVYYVTDSGLAYTWTNSAAHATTMLGEGYVAEDYNGTTLKPADKVLTYEATGKATTEVPNFVTTTEELVDLINNTTANENDLNITLAGNGIEFNSKVLNAAIARKLSQPIVFTGSINIVGGDKDEAMDINVPVVFDKATVEKNSYIKFNNLQLNYNELTVEKDATLTVARAYSSTTGSIENNGTLTLNADAYSVVNNGTLNLNATANSVENNGTLVLGAKGSIENLTTTATEGQNVTISNDITLSISELIGTWTVSDGATLTLDEAATLPYGSTLTVNGKLIVNTLTVSGTLDVNGDLKGDVTLDGTLKTSTSAAKNAVVNLNKGAKVLSGTIAGTASKAEAQILNIQDGVNVAGTITNTNLKAQYSFTGDITKAADITVPTYANTLTITGDIEPSANLTLGNTSISDLTINGNISSTTSYTVTIAASNTGKVKINGDVTVASTKAVTISNAKEVEVTGTLTTSAAFTSSADKLVLNKVQNETNGTVTAKSNGTIYVSEMWLNDNLTIDQENLILRGDVTIVSGKTLTLPGSGKTTKISGNVSFDGSGEVSAQNSEIQVLGNSKLTNNIKIAGAASNLVTFVSNSNKEDGTAYTGTVKRGQVVNNGTVSYATTDYKSDATDENGGKGWWTGTAAAIN